MTVGKTDEIKQELARKVENTKAGTKINLKFITQSVIISKNIVGKRLRGWNIPGVFLHIKE